MKKKMSRMPAPMVAPAMMPTGNTSSDRGRKGAGVRVEPYWGSELSVGHKLQWQPWMVYKPKL